MSLDAASKAEVFGRFDTAIGSRIGLAVSGGSDSMALAALAVDWARLSGRDLATVTVDHGLRPEAASEAQRVASFSAEMGISHETLEWRGWDGRGNLQDEARRARAKLIGDWATANGISAIATGHTHDDQAETVLMRLARGSGVDGLSAMADTRDAYGVTWHRPLLTVSRSDLRDYLASEGLPWIEDPSNDDLTYDRVKARRALEVLADLGITRDGLVATADRMRRARRALELATATLAADVVKTDRGDALVDWATIGKHPEEIQNRMVCGLLQWISGAEYRPRASALSIVMLALNEGRTAVLAGCLMTAEGSQRRFAREHAAVGDHHAPLGQEWDGRWRILGPGNSTGEIRALGEDGVRACPDWRESGLPRSSLIASPSVWQGDRLVAAPLAGFGQGWTAKNVRTFNIGG